MPEYKTGNRGRIVVSEKSKRESDNMLFDSMIEKEAYELFRDSVGLRNFVMQPKFLLQPGFVDVEGNKVRPIYYIADFAFFTKKKEFNKTIPAQVVVVDIKGMQDSVFKLKHKMFSFKFNKKLFLPKTKKQVKDLIQFLTDQTNERN